MTRAALLSALMLLVACNGGGTTNPDPPPPPPPGTLYRLEPSLKPIPSSALTTRAPTAGEFWVGRGNSLTLTINAKQLSPLAKKIRLEVSVSGSGLGVTPLITTLEGSNSVDLTVSLDAGVSATEVPYFFIYGYPLDANNRTLGDPLREDYRWNLARPPVTP